jgi:adenylosuccinate synthase
MMNSKKLLKPNFRKPIAVVGAQLGDEGKGKLVDLLAAKAKVVARFNGGNNAGHTVNRNGIIFKFQSLPSGVGIPGILNVIGNGAVINVPDLLDEIKGLARDHQGMTITPADLQISELAHLVLPIHKELDVFREELSRGTSGFIGTTGNGIGPAYSDKVARIGIRAGDLIQLQNPLASTSLRSKVLALVTRHFFELQSFAARDLIFEKKDSQGVIIARWVAKDLYPSIDAVVQRVERELVELAPLFTSFVATDIPAPDLLRRADAAGENILYEGGQSILLDIDHGTVPYVTSSSTGGNAVVNGTGYKTSREIHVIGVAKAYVTRVGSGPFPSQMIGSDAALGEMIRKLGGEFGTVTGRSRDIGWFDLVALKHAIQAGGIQSLALMKSDILDGLDEIKVATSYSSAVGPMNRIPMQNWLWESLKPTYTTLKGWKDEKPVLDARQVDDLAPSFLKFVRFIESEAGIPVSFIGTGPEREQIIELRPDLFA